jgi:tRNA uridine 5-carboxymethylaminomethyl modification enzyme
MIRLRNDLQARTLTPQQAAVVGLQINRDGQRRSAWQLLSYPAISFDRLRTIWPDLGVTCEQAVIDRVSTDAAYEVYLERQQQDIDIYERDNAIIFPIDLNFDSCPGLSQELKTKLTRQRPTTLAQAARLEGMTPAALTILAVQARKHRRAPAIGKVVAHETEANSIATHG